MGKKSPNPKPPNIKHKPTPPPGTTKKEGGYVRCHKCKK